MPDSAPPVDVLDRSLRLYSRDRLAELADCSLRTVDYHLSDPHSPLEYTHRAAKPGSNGKKGMRVSYAKAQEWLGYLAELRRRGRPE